MTLRISSSQNPRYKQAIKLRDTRQRKRSGLSVIDGYREIGRALAAGIEVDSLFVREGSVAGTRVSATSSASVLVTDDQPSKDEQLFWEHWSDVPTDHRFIVSTEMMEKMSYGDRASDVVAVVRTPDWNLGSLQPKPGVPLILVLDRMEKPGNLGAALRTADAAGASAVILSDPECEPMNPNAIRASMGAMFTVPIACATAEETIAWLRSHQLQIVAARVDGSRFYSEVDLQLPTAVVLGSEAYGLADAWHAESIHPIRIPMLGMMDSLNVSVAAAVLLYETLRQRTTIRN